MLLSLGALKGTSDLGANLSGISVLLKPSRWAMGQLPSLIPGTRSVSLACPPVLDRRSFLSLFAGFSALPLSFLFFISFFVPCSRSCFCLHFPPPLGCLASPFCFTTSLSLLAQPALPFVFFISFSLALSVPASLPASPLVLLLLQGSPSPSR